MAGSVVPRLRQVVLDSTDARRCAEIWRELLGLVYRADSEPPPPGEDDPAGRDWLVLHAPDGSPCLAVQQVARQARSTWPEQEVPQQLHLDLTVSSVAELESVHVRVLGLDAQQLLDRTDDPAEPLRVYADPDGHPFCVFVSD